MKKHLAMLLLTALSMPAMATFLNTPDGDRIRKGDAAARVLVKLGQPLQKNYSRVCRKSNSAGHCVKWIRVENWTYLQGDLYWTVEIRNGTVNGLDWTRH